MATRLLISSYFVVVGLCLVESPLLTTLIGPDLLPPVAAQSIQVLVLGAATLVMMAHFVRPAALFLIVFTLISSAVHFSFNWSDGALSKIWGEVSLVGALLMIALTAQPIAFEVGRVRRKARSIRPRRVQLADDDLQPQIDEIDEDDLDGPVNLMAVETDFDDEFSAEDEAPDTTLGRGEMSNLFHDLWDERTPIRAREQVA